MTPSAARFLEAVEAGNAVRTTASSTPEASGLRPPCAGPSGRRRRPARQGHDDAGTAERPLVEPVYRLKMPEVVLAHAWNAHPRTSPGCEDLPKKNVAIFGNKKGGKLGNTYRPGRLGEFVGSLLSGRCFNRFWLPRSVPAPGAAFYLFVSEQPINRRSEIATASPVRARVSLMNAPLFRACLKTGRRAVLADGLLWQKAGSGSQDALPRDANVAIGTNKDSDGKCQHPPEWASPTIG